MSNDKNIGNKIYFIGIGGIGMSALARYFRFHGKEVSGYDKTETPLTKELVNEGIPVHYADNPNLIPKDADLIVYTPAIPADHRELQYYRERDYRLLKRSEVLGLITSSSFNICVAGTHGKTTISTMIAHILRHSGYGCNAFLGGIAVNYNSNYWSDKRNVCVVEADEYDRSFLKLNPDIAVITAMDADHLDIYGTAEAMEEAFIGFTQKIKPGGLLISKFGLSRDKDLRGSKRIRYSLQNEKADAFAKDIRMSKGGYEYDVVKKDWMINAVRLNMGGMHNVENTVAAISVAQELGIENEKIKAAVEAFRGVKRRFEYIIRKDDLVFIDDYAHHPEELRALISSAKALFSGMKCTVVFQPHLYTRTRDLVEGFAESLGLADEVFLLPIYPARESPIPGVTSEMIAGKIRTAKVDTVSKEELLRRLSNKMKDENGIELFITAGAGDIDAMLPTIKNVLEKK